MKKIYKVLIVDDEPWSRTVIKSLGLWNELDLLIVGEAEDGIEEIKLIEELKPDIVITDMRMPGLEGETLLKTLNRSFPSLKIIIMSGYDDFAYMKQAIISKAVDYLLKPINPEELNDSLERCINEIKEMALEKLPKFTDSAFLDKYIAYKQQLFVSLLQLNKISVINTFQKLLLFLKEVIKEKENFAVLNNISRDLSLIIDDFNTENRLEHNKTLNNKAINWNEKWDPKCIEEFISDFQMSFIQAIEAVTDSKNKTHLDLNEVKLYIDNHFQEQIMLDSIAQHFFISKEYLSRAFKTNIGENISDYIIKKRMEKAKELILEDKLEIKDIAQVIGYEDIAYFYRVFKKYFGMPPGKLRSK